VSFNDFFHENIPSYPYNRKKWAKGGIEKNFLKFFMYNGMQVINMKWKMPPHGGKYKLVATK